MSTTDTRPASAEALASDIEALGERLRHARQSISRVIFGQQQVIEQTLIALLSGGHVLLIGVPGLAKTRLVETLHVVLGLDDRRIQCTPDLMPSDILGSEVLEEGEGGRRSFRFIPGPVFCQVLMADEVNRASPRTQSALLQAMQERRVTIAGRAHPLPEPFHVVATQNPLEQEGTYPLPEPFHVVATQNPLEQEGTYPLPEAQLDRFLMQIDIGYPDNEAERQMLIATTGLNEDKPRAVMTAAELIAGQTLIRRIPVGNSVVDAILKLVRSARPDETGLTDVTRHIAWGPGPRASQALMLAVRARAALEGRLAPSVDDVLALAHPVLRHRMALNFAARADGVTLDALIDRLCQPLA